jgi:hypothetical protein
MWHTVVLVASGAMVQGLSTSSAPQACVMTPALVSAAGPTKSRPAVQPTSALLPHASLAAQALLMLLLCLCQLSMMVRLLPLQLPWSLLLLWLVLIPLLLLSLLRRQQWHLLLRPLWKLLALVVLLPLLMQLLLLLQSLLLPQHQWPQYPLGKLWLLRQLLCLALHPKCALCAYACAVRLSVCAVEQVPL